MNKNEDMDNLPLWDLSDFYQSFEDEALLRDVAEVRAESAKIEQQYKGVMEKLNGNELADLIEKTENFSQIIGKLLSFASLSHAVNLQDEEVGRQVQALRESLQEAIDGVLFVSLTLKKLPESFLEQRYQESSRLQAWCNWLKDEREWSAHQLLDELEAYIESTSIVAEESWHRLFDETMAYLRCDIKGEAKTLTETLHLFADKDENVRKEALISLQASLEERAPLLTHITNTLVKMKSISDDKRSFVRPDESRHKRNLVEAAVVDSCVGAVKRSYGALSHRYYAMKAGWMGKKQLKIWDRLAPPPGSEGSKFIPWESAKNEVVEGFASFSENMGEIALKFFDKESSWIDAKPREGKASGAFSASTVPSVHPYIMMNYQGKKRDVMTLAHEMGHGIHQYLASAEQGYFRSSTPLTLAETASVFGEMIVFQRLLQGCQSEAEKFFLLANKIEDMLATVVRQISFYDFEYRLHEARRKAPLTTEEINKIWCGVAVESLGPSVDVDKDIYGIFWSYVPHFIHTPFYVYSYAFGDCLVNGLYRCYQDGMPNFVGKYEEMLKKGGSLRHQELLAPFGIDVREETFWQGALSVISEMMDELADMKVPAYGG